MADLKAIKLPNGITYNLKDAVARPNSPFYGSCSTAAATAEKAVLATGFSLVAGAKVVVKFTVTNTAANPTLNVNSTGAKAIYYRGAAITAGCLAANRTYEFVYNGSQYELIGDLDTNTTYSSKTAASGGTDVSLVTTGEKYTWNNKSTLAIGTTSTTAAAGNHTHPISIATDSGTNQLTLAASTKYKLTAGGNSYIFTTPPNTNTDTKVNVVARGTTKAYLLGTTTSPTSTAAGVTSVAETGVYFDTVASTLVAGGLVIDVDTSPRNWSSTDAQTRQLLSYRYSGTSTTTKCIIAGAVSESSINTDNGTAVSFGACGLTIIGAGEVAGKILQRAASSSPTNKFCIPGTTTNANIGSEDLILASDNTIGLYPGYQTISGDIVAKSYFDANGTFNGPSADVATIQSSLSTTTWLRGNQGIALVNSTAPAGNFVTLLKSNSTNGYFAMSNHGSALKLTYTAKTTVDAGTNSATKTVTLLDELGNTSFSGTVSVGTPTANTHAATKAYVDASTHPISIVTDSGTNQLTLAASTKYKLTAGGNSYIFTTPGDTHYTTHLYAGGGSAANAATTNGSTKLTVTDNSAVRNSVTLKGILGTNVSSDANGVISIGNGIAKTNQEVAVSSTTADNWQVIANGEMTGNSDINIVFAVTDNVTHANGLLTLGVRCTSNVAVTDQSSNNGPRLEWISRHKDINPNYYRLRVTNWKNSGTPTKCTWELETYHHRRYYAVSFEVIQASGTTGSDVPAYTLHTDGAAPTSNGNTYISRDVLPFGGTWNSSNHNTDNATGITIGSYGNTKTTNSNAVAIGNSCVTTGDSGGVAIGVSNKSAAYATSLGYNNTSSGADSFTAGRDNTASQFASSAIGFDNRATAQLAAAIGMKNSVSGVGGTAFGLMHSNSSHGCAMVGISGQTKTAHASTTIGVDDGDVFVVGNGTVTNTGSEYSYTRRNAFRVSYKGNVYLYSGGAHQSTGADYAEFVKEWWDGNPDNEDRVGYMVTIGEDNKLHKANEGDYIIGITSGAPAVIGNVDTEYFWKYKKDEFNRMIYDSTEVIVDGKPVISNEPIISDTYNPELEDSYITRANRPEWDYVGMRGIVPCRDDGTCVARGFCKCGTDGIATKADTRGYDTYYVIERINDHVISIEVR